MRRIPDLKDIADRLKTDLDGATLKDCSRIVLIGHSQGGLVIQRYLAEELSHGRGQELRRIRGVVMLATPNTGSQLFLSVRRFLDHIWYHPQERTLRPFNDQIEEMRKTILEQVVYASTNSDSTCPIPFHVYAGDQDGVVPAKSAKWFFPRAGTLPGDHTSIKNPQTRDAPVCTSIVRALRQAWDSFPPDRIVMQTCALNAESKREIQAVIDLQNDGFSPSAQIRIADLEYWVDHYEATFGVHLALIVAKIDENIVGFMMFHEFPRWIVVDYVAVRQDTEARSVVLRLLMDRLNARARALDVSVIFEVEDPDHLPGEHDKSAAARIRLFEMYGARVIKGLRYLAPHMDRFPATGQEEKYLLMYARPTMEDHLTQSEVQEIVNVMYGTWYRNWFSRGHDSPNRDSYLDGLIETVTRSIPETCPLPKRYGKHA
jgi:hypothetical protein